MTVSPYRLHTEAAARAALGVDLMSWVRSELAAGISWRSIPDRLHDATEGTVKVTRQSLRSWWIEDGREDVAA